MCLRPGPLASGQPAGAFGGLRRARGAAGLPPGRGPCGARGRASVAPGPCARLHSGSLRRRQVVRGSDRASHLEVHAACATPRPAAPAMEQAAEPRFPGGPRAFPGGSRGRGAFPADPLPRGARAADGPAGPMGPPRLAPGAHGHGPGREDAAAHLRPAAPGRLRAAAAGGGVRGPAHARRPARPVAAAGGRRQDTAPFPPLRPFLG